MVETCQDIAISLKIQVELTARHSIFVRYSRFTPRAEAYPATLYVQVTWGKVELVHFNTSYKLSEINGSTLSS